MSKFFKRFKVKTIVAAMIVLSILSIAITDFLGLTGISTVNNNVEDLYKDNLIGITRLGSVRSDFINIRLNAEKAMLKYDSVYVENIKVYNEKLEARIKQFEETKLDEYETNKTKEIRTSINEYINTWEKIKMEIENKEEILGEDSKRLESLGNKTENIILELRDYNEKQAEELNSASEKIYLNKVKELFYTGVVILLLLSLIGYSIIKLIGNSINETINNLELVASGDLTASIHSDEKNEFAIMKKSLRKTVDNIREMINVIKNQSLDIHGKAESFSAISEEMSSVSQNISTAIEEVAQGTSTQSEGIIDITVILDEFNKVLEDTINVITGISAGTGNIESMAEDSNVKMNDLIVSIKNVHEVFNDFSLKISSLGLNVNQINQILNLINEIADQTNLLSLNASIEASRAGVSGRGFSVVADEIGKLAEQSKVSSVNIASLVKQISTDTNTMIATSDNLKKELFEQLKISEIAMMSFNNIKELINDMTPQINNANLSMNSIKEQKNAIIEKLESASAISQEVSASAEEVSASTEEMNASSEEVASAALELSGMTKKIVSSMEKFKL